MILICLLYEAFIAHYNAPRFYAELKNPTVPRFRTVVLVSFGASTVVTLLVMVFGFWTFGANCDGYILNNYSDKDELITFCRILIAIAITLTYPITFLGARDGVLDVLKVPQWKQTSHTLNFISVILLIIISRLLWSLPILVSSNCISSHSSFGISL